MEKEKLKKEIIKDEKIKDEKIEEKLDENEDKENKELVKTNKELVKTDKEKEIDTTTEIIIKDSLKEKDNLKDKEKQEKDNLKDKEKQDKFNDDDKEKNKQLIENVPAKKDREPIQRTISAPPTIDEVTACGSCCDLNNICSGVLSTNQSWNISSFNNPLLYLTFS